MEKLKKMYGLEDPQDIKMRIMWMALKELLKASFGKSPRNMKVLDKFDEQWRQLEGRKRK